MKTNRRNTRLPRKPTPEETAALLEAMSKSGCSGYQMLGAYLDIHQLKLSMPFVFTEPRGSGKC